MPAGVGDLSMETHGIAPIPAEHRYGAPWRLFTVWFAPNLVMSAVFTGSLGVALGLDVTAGAAAVVLGTLLGALPVAWLATWGPRTGMGQLPLARWAFGGAVVLPGLVQWASSVCWDALVGLFGGEAVAELTGWPFWAATVLVLALQGLAGVLGYEVIHRLQTVMSVVLGVLFAILTVRLLGASHPAAGAGTATGTSAVGAFLLFTAITLSTAISWAPYASDFSRYLPAATPPRRVFGFTLAGLLGSYVWVEVLGLAAAAELSDQTARGLRAVLGGGAVGSLAMVAVGLSAVASNAMNDYSGSLALQTVGVRVRRPVTAVVVTVAALALVLWMHGGDLAAKFQNVLLLVGYWIPPFVAVVGLDWVARMRRARRGPARSGCADRRLSAARGVAAPARTPCGGRARAQARPRTVAALVAFLAGCGAGVPFMNTTLFTGPAARALAGADLAFYVGFVVAGVVYGGWAAWAARAARRTPAEGPGGAFASPMPPGSEPVTRAD